MKLIKLPENQRYQLKQISLREIVDKYPDKVVKVVDRKKNTVLYLNNMRIIFQKTKKGV